MVFSCFPKLVVLGNKIRWALLRQVLSPRRTFTLARKPHRGTLALGGSLGPVCTGLWPSVTRAIAASLSWSVRDVTTKRRRPSALPQRTLVARVSGVWTPAGPQGPSSGPRSSVAHVGALRGVFHRGRDPIPEGSAPTPAAPPTS